MANDPSPAFAFTSTSTISCRTPGASGTSNWPATPRASVRHLIETLGVPHTEVELIIANGELVDLEYAVADGDRVASYPVFEALDVTPLLRAAGQAPARSPVSCKGNSELIRVS